jgi:hypothetical protein
MPQVPTQLGHRARHQAQDAHTLGQLASTELRTFQQALDALRLGPDLRLQQACLCCRQRMTGRLEQPVQGVDAAQLVHTNSPYVSGTELARLHQR